MAVSNIAVPNTGSAPVAVISDGTQSHQTVILEFLPTAGSTAPKQVSPDGNELPIADVPRLLVVAASAMTRPANVTAYTANDAVSNNATAASVTAISFTLADINDAPLALERCRMATTDTGPGTAGASFRVYFYQSDPTASTGVVGGDNAAFSTKQGTFIGSMAGAFSPPFSDGGVAVCTPEQGARIVTKPTSGAKTVFALLQTLTAFTPSANSTTFTLTIEGFQGRS